MTLRLANCMPFNLLNLPPIYKPKVKGEMQLFCKKKIKETTSFFSDMITKNIVFFLNLFFKNIFLLILYSGSNCI